MWCCVIGEVKQKFGVKRVDEWELKKQRRQRQRQRKRHLKINILEMVTILLLFFLIQQIKALFSGVVVVVVLA